MGKTFVFIPEPLQIKRQSMSEFLPSVIYTFSALFVILDPLLSLPIFTSLTKGMTPGEINKQALIAIGVAGFLMYIFLFFNILIFDVLGITLPEFQTASGILLFILGMQMTLGVTIGKEREGPQSVAGVVIGTPILCGPGTITTVMLLSKQYGVLVVALSTALCLVASWLVLRYSQQIRNLIGDTVTEVIGKMLGMFTAAIAIKIISDGIRALV